MMFTPFKSLRDLLAPAFRRPEFLQAAALCLREGALGREVLMVTSLGTRRWVLPKGWPMKGRTLAGAALREAWEEAGVIGSVNETPCGYFTYEKRKRGGFSLACRVEVFRVEVSDLARDWPERKRRKRAWLPVDEAAAAVDEPELQALLHGL